MLRYDDNHCDELEDAFNVNNRIIKELKKELTDCRDQLNSALRYGFEKNQENARLHQHLLQRAQTIEKERNDGEDRQATGERFKDG